METLTFYASTDPTGDTTTLIRRRQDDEAKKLWLERLLPSGEWEDDPSLIDDLQEIGTHEISADEAAQIEQNITSYVG